MRFTKLTATLFATTIMANIVVMPEPTHGMMTGVHRAQAQAAAERTKQADAIAHTAAALNGSAPVLRNTLLKALDAAANDSQSDAHLGANTTNVEQRIAALKKVSKGAGPRDKTVHYPAIRIALGIEKLPEAEANEYIEVLLSKANKELVVLPKAARKLQVQAGKARTLAEKEQAMNTIKTKLEAGVPGILRGGTGANAYNFGAPNPSDEQVLRTLMQTIAFMTRENAEDVARPIIAAGTVVGATADQQAAADAARDIMASIPTHDELDAWLQAEFNFS